MTTEQSLREEFKELMKSVPQPDKIQQHAHFSDRDMIDYWIDVLEPKISNYWLSKFAAYKESFLKDAKELHEKFLTGNIREDVKNCKDCSCDHYILGIDDFYHDLLSKQDTQ